MGELINNINKKNLRNITLDDTIYGSDATENIIRNAKLYVIFNILSATTKREIQFDDLTKEFGLNLEDLEDVMFDADSLNLFKLVIDYSKSLVTIRYIRKMVYDKEYVENLRAKTSALREKV